MTKTNQDYKALEQISHVKINPTTPCIITIIHCKKNNRTLTLHCIPSGVSHTLILLYIINGVKVNIATSLRNCVHIQ